MNNIQNNCLVCNKEIDYYQSSINKKNGKKYFNYKRPKKYCSEICAGKARQVKKINICRYCYNIFMTIESVNLKYCSTTCAGNANQNCKKVKSWQYRNNNTVKKPRIFKYKKCTNCNNQTNRLKYCNKCSENKEIQRAKNRYIDKKKGIHIMKKILIHMSGGCCKKCGYNKSKSSLVFHHINNKDKLFTLDISTIMKKDINSIILEHSKCELLCHNCHSILHNKERNTKAEFSKRKNRRNKYIKRKLDYIKSIGGKCINCNLEFNSDNLQSASFHHREPKNKKFELNCNAFMRKTDKEIEDELNKCDLLCMNCHMSI